MTFIILCIMLKKDKFEWLWYIKCLLTFQDKIHYCLDALIGYLHDSTIFLLHLWFYLHLFICVQTYTKLSVNNTNISKYKYLHVFKHKNVLIYFLAFFNVEIVVSPALKPFTSTEAHVQKFLFDG